MDGDKVDPSLAPIQFKTHEEDEVDYIGSNRAAESNQSKEIGNYKTNIRSARIATIVFYSVVQTLIIIALITDLLELKQTERILGLVCEWINLIVLILIQIFFAYFFRRFKRKA